jgi:MFS family permease
MHNHHHRSDKPRMHMTRRTARITHVPNHCCTDHDSPHQCDGQILANVSNSGADGGASLAAAAVATSAAAEFLATPYLASMMDRVGRKGPLVASVAVGVLPRALLTFVASGGADKLLGKSRVCAVMLALALSERVCGQASYGMFQTGCSAMCSDMAEGTALVGLSTRAAASAAVGVVVGPLLGGRVVDAFGAPVAAFALGTALGAAQLMVASAVLSETLPTPSLQTREDSRSLLNTGLSGGATNSTINNTINRSVAGCANSDERGGTDDENKVKSGTRRRDGISPVSGGPLGMLRLFTSSRAMALLAGSTALQCMTENKSILDLFVNPVLSVVANKRRGERGGGGVPIAGAFLLSTCSLVAFLLFYLLTRLLRQCFPATARVACSRFAQCNTFTCVVECTFTCDIATSSLTMP